MRSKILRLTLWITGGIAALLIAVVLCAWFYSRTDHFRALLQEQALAALRNSVNGEVNFERLTGSVWRELDFHKVSIRQNGIEIISIPKLSVTFSLMRQALSFAFYSSLHVARIEITEPAVRLIQDENREWNIHSLLKRPDKPEEPPKLTIFLNQIELKNGRIDAQLADGKSVNLTSISAEGNVGLLSTGVKADVPALNFSLASEGIPPVQWTSVFAFQATDSTSLLDLRDLRLRTAESQLRLSGEVRDLAKPDMALSLEVNRVSAAEAKLLLPDLPVRQDLSGLIKITGPSSALRLTGSLRFPDGTLHTSVLADLTKTQPQVQGTVEAKDFVLDKVLSIPDLSGNLNGRTTFQGRSWETAQASSRASVSSLVAGGWQLGDLNLAADLKDQKIALDTKLTSENGQARMEGQIALGNDPAYEATVTVRKLDVKKMAKQVAVPIAAEVNLDAWIKGRGTDLAGLDASGNITLLPSRLGSVEGLQGKVMGTLRQGILTLNEVKLVSNGTTLNAQGKISAGTKAPNGKITYRVRAQEIAPWTALAGLEGKGSIDVDGSATGSLKALALEGKANLSKLQVAGSSLQSGSVAWKLSGVGGSRPRGKIKVVSRDIYAGIPLRTLEGDLSLDGIEPMNIQASLVAEDREKHNHRLRGRARYSSDYVDFVVDQLTLHFANGEWRTAQPAHFQLKEDRL
ncbi:MAG: AsmA family protein, partial [Candidatus Binatia bacterium]